jgi:hypothetical protein
MKTRWPLCGILLGLLTLPCTLSTAQDTTAAEPPPSAPVAPKAQPEASLTEKLKMARLSPSAREVIKMSDSGMDAGLLQSYVENSSSVYTLTSDDVIFLHEQGIPSSVITAMLQRSARVRDQVAASTPPPAPPAPAAAPAPVYQQVQQPAPTYIVQQPAPAPIIVPGPSYTYAAPSSVIYVGSGYSSYCYPRYSRPYFGFHYSSGWNSPHFYGGFGYRHCR